MIDGNRMHLEESRRNDLIVEKDVRLTLCLLDNINHVLKISQVEERYSVINPVYLLLRA